MSVLLRWNTDIALLELVLVPVLVLALMLMLVLVLVLVLVQVLMKKRPHHLESPFQAQSPASDPSAPPLYRRRIAQHRQSEHTD